MKKRIFSIMLTLAMLLSVFPQMPVSAQKEEVELMDTYSEADSVIKLNPSNASPFNGGKFEGWGTSMGWWGNRIGYSDKLAEDSARLLFSDEEGLGLDIVRYNVGGGDDPTHAHINRTDSKLPCLAIPQTNEDGSFVLDENGDVVFDYKWDNDYNQVNVLEEIKKTNPNVHIEGYTNSPPWFMTNSGCSGGGVDATENLDPKNYDIFAKFLADVTEHFEEIGLKFDSYSPMNEPNPKSGYWGAYSNKQEGNHVEPGANQSGIINALSDEYDSRGIDTLVVGLDETSIDYSITSFNALDAKAKENLDRLDTHTYGGSKRAQLKQTAIDAGKNLWMSEVDGGWNAFGLADRIILDMNAMQPSAWVMWDIIDFHKDSNAVAPDGSKPDVGNSMKPDGTMWGVAMANHDTQEIELSMKYYGFGQFTRYIKPGMTIIDSAANSLAAYDSETGEIVLVVTNNSGSSSLTEIDLRDFVSTGSSARMIRTSGSFASGEKWTELPEIPVVDKKFTATIAPNSITTFVIENDNWEKISLEPTIDITDSKITYSYAIPQNIGDVDTYLAVYDSNGVLVAVTKNELSGEIMGNFAGCTTKLFVWNDMEPVVFDTNITYMTIEGSTSAVTGAEYNYSVVTGPTAVNTPVTWSVSDETVATVTSDGVLKVLTGGNVTLTATADVLGVSTSIDIEVIDSSQTVTIVNRHSGLGLETQGKNIHSGSLLVQWAYRGLDTSAWKLSPTDDGHFNIINQNAGMLLVANADAKPAISSEIAATDAAAKWDLINHGGYYEIKNVSVGKSLNVSGQSTADGGSVILYDFGGGNNELWSLNPVDGELEHVVPAPPADYSENYVGTDYKYISNIDSLTNDFLADLKGFVISGTAALSTDSGGEAVLLVQKEGTNAGKSGAATLTLDTPATCADGQIIHLALDMYAPHSGGTSDFILSSSDDTELVKIQVSDWGGKYTLAIGGETVEEAGNAGSYFKNGTGDRTYDAYITNGGHVEVYYKPSTGDITVTIKNKTNADPVKEYKGTVAAGKDIGKVHFAGTYDSYARKMLVDNLITNIIMDAALTGTVEISGTAKVGETLTATVSGINDGVTPKYQWQANTGEEGAYVDIDGATENTYVIADTLVGKSVRCVVSADGFDVVLTSEATIEIIAAGEVIPTLSGTVTVAESAYVGKTLTAEVADINEGAVAKYQWQMNNGEESAYAPIEGATASTLKLTDNMIGYSVKCVVTADNFDGKIESTPTDEITKRTIEGTVAISGNPKLGSTLTAEVADVDEDAVVKYQWQSNTGDDGAYVDIAGATASTLKLTDAMIGYSVKCVVTAEDFNGSIESDETIGVYDMSISGNDVVVTGTDYTYSATVNAEEASDVEWTVSDEGIATIDNGILNAVSGGKITITATTADKQTATYDVLVVDTEANITLTSKKSGLGLETKDHAIAANTTLVQYQYRGIDTSAWKLAATDDGYFNIINQNAGMLLASNGGLVITDEIAETDDNAKWQLIAHNGAYEIKNVAGEKKSLNVSGASVANNGNVILYAFAGADNELWNINVIEDELIHIEADTPDYLLKYALTDYTFVNNVEAVTNDFENDFGGFVLADKAALTTDYSGAKVLGVQPLLDNNDGVAQTGSAVLELEDSLTCDEGQLVNIAFDLYCSNSGGTADFILYGSDDAEFAKMVVSGWDNFDMTIGETVTNEAGGAKTYLRNGVNDKDKDQLMSNGGHFEIYFNPATGDMKITLVNNTNSSEMKVYEGNVGTDAAITKIAFHANYTTWSKPMYLDNLMTNIIAEKE